jgi:phosphatidylserine/phosphatidylglycerophosphate/cardiolipin synthase-like enzyme
MHAVRAPATPDVGGFDDGIQAQVTRSTAQKGSTDAEQLFYAAIACARERIWLTTAYFAPRQAFVEALCEAEGRGVDVRVLTNGAHTDQEVVRQAGRRCYEQLLGCGGRIFEYQRTMLHAKVLLVDSHWVTVGSVNFDNRSFALNDELSISFRDLGVVAELEQRFLADLEDARELTLAAWRARPLAMRARELASALVRRELQPPGPGLGCAPLPRPSAASGHRGTSWPVQGASPSRGPPPRGRNVARRTRQVRGKSECAVQSLGQVARDLRRTHKRYRVNAVLDSGRCSL